MTKAQQFLEDVNRSWRALAAIGAAVLFGIVLGSVAELPGEVRDHDAALMEHDERITQNRHDIDRVLGRLDRLVCIQLAEAANRSATECESAG